MLGLRANHAGQATTQMRLALAHKPRGWCTCLEAESSPLSRPSLIKPASRKKARLDQMRSRAEDAPARQGVLHEEVGDFLLKREICFFDKGATHLQDEPSTTIVDRSFN